MKNAMVDMSLSGAPHTSILQYIIGANYDEYTEQRFQLRQVFESCDRFDHCRSPPPPPPGLPPSDGEAPPPPPPPGIAPPEPSERPHADKGAPKGPKAKQASQQKLGAQNGAGKQASVKAPPPGPRPAPNTKPPKPPKAPKTSNEKKQHVQMNGAADKVPAPISSSAPATASASKETSSAEGESGSEQEPSANLMTKKARATQRRNVKCQERAARLQRLRPDLKVKGSVSLRQARLLAGYKDNAEMEKDLDAREKQVTAAQSSA